MKRSALKITPFDTLFFRGTLPMEAGKSCSMSLFPPTPDTVTGALRTALLAANGIGIDDFKRGKTIPEVGTYGHADQQFKVVGIGVENDSVLYAKAPVALFPLEGGKVELAMQVSPSETGLGISSSSPTVFIAPPDREANAKGLASAWCDIRMFSDKSLRTTEHIVMPEAVSSQLFSYEVRTGIAIDPKTGMAQEHMLYSAGHVRMAQGASLVVIVDCDLPLPESGTIRLGGEGRLSHYEKTSLDLPDGNRGMFVSLAPVKVTEEARGHMLAASRPVLTGGWDQARHFHKPGALYYPAGAIFDCDLDGVTLPWAI